MTIKFETEHRRRKQLTVAIIPAKLEGGVLNDGQCRGVCIRVETRVGILNKNMWLSPSKEVRGASSRRVVGGGGVEWGENDGVLVTSCSDQCELDLLFCISRKVEGRYQKSEKWEEMGRVGMRVVDLWKKVKVEVKRKLPIQLRGGKSVSTLTVVLRIEAEDGGVELSASGESSKTGLMRLLSFPALKRNKVVNGSPSPDLREFTRSSSMPSLEMGTRPSTKKRGILKSMGSWFYGNRKKVELVVCRDELLGEKTNGDGMNDNVMWQVKKIVSRDGETELMCSVGLASYDQCSAKVGGEGACSVIAVVIAHWLHANQRTMPNKAEFDRLLMEGANEWKKLCNNKDFSGGFPNKHYDMETVMSAAIRPLEINHENSVVGFFSPEKFELLNGVACVDAIWYAIEKRPGVYIVSWNDHFCVLKVEEDACYVIDSLGKRLTAECKEAFILKFDQFSMMKHTKQVCPEGAADSKPKETCSATKSDVKEGEANGEVESATKGKEPVKAEIICKGRECCKEYFKRFLAAIPVRQLELNALNGIMCSTDLHRMLQIEFQYTICVKK